MSSGVCNRSSVNSSKTLGNALTIASGRATFTQRRRTPSGAVGCKRKAVHALLAAYRSSNWPRALKVSQARCSETLFEKSRQAARLLRCGALAAHTTANEMPSDGSVFMGGSLHVRQEVAQLCAATIAE